jgi:hypothetical protein
MSLVIENQLFPCIDYMKKLIESKYVKIEQCESFQKMSFRNRYVISGANGIQSLTIPIKGGREQKTSIKQVEIDNISDWRTKHWRSLLSAYSKAPYFEFYGGELKEMLFSEESFLFSLNIKILNWICNKLKVNVLISFTDSFNINYSGDIDYRNFFLPKSYQQNRANWQPRYVQVFEERIGFQPNLSIIDLLMCEGPNAANLLIQSSK